MTDEERWKLEGRTRDALRQAKCDMGRYRMEIMELMHKLQRANDGLCAAISYLEKQITELEPR